MSAGSCLEGSEEVWSMSLRKMERPSGWVASMQMTELGTKSPRRMPEVVGWRGDRDRWVRNQMLGVVCRD